MEIHRLIIDILWMIPLGFAVGMLGTLIGAGGGFILLPILILIYPNETPATLTSISLAVVFLNTLSGTISYSKMNRVDYKGGLLFATTLIPGTVIATFMVNYISIQVFSLIFSIVLIAGAIFLILKPEKDIKAIHNYYKNRFYITRVIKDHSGEEYKFSYNPIIGCIISFFVGFISGFLGIGGGIIHVPALIHLLNYPVHLATATSHFMLAIMSFSATVIHIMTGSLDEKIMVAILIGIGVTIGAPIGAKLSNKIHGKWIVRALGITLLLVGIRLFIKVML